MTEYDVGFEELIKKLKQSFSEKEIEKISKAYDIANEAHKNQRRRSGEPYIIHPVAVAKILCDMGMDVDSLCAALLHDVVEDTDMTDEDIRAVFGKDVELSDSALALSVRFDIAYDGERSFALVLSDSAFIYFDGAKTCLYKDGACVLQLSAMTKVDIGVKANGEINLLMGDQYVCLSVVEIESVRFVSLFGEGRVTIEGLEVVIY